MKLITFAVPCYNSANYMRHCIDTLLTGGDDVEIIIVNDGSKDETSFIAHEYADKFDNIRVVDKENGGHGSGVNKGLELAQGMYYKVVDSDDWVDEKALGELIALMKKHMADDCLADLYITNYVYENVFVHKQHIQNYVKNLPMNRFFGWKEVKKFHTSTVMMMHALWYKTEKLRLSNTILPEHTFYVDNIYAFKPLPFMEKLYYADLNVYRYFIGREDQSVNVENIVKRYDQQIRVVGEMTGFYSYKEIKAMPKGLKNYLLHDLSVVMILALMFTTGGNTDIPKRKKAIKDMWRDLKKKDKKMYNYLFFTSYPALVNFLPFALQGKVMLCGYKVVRNKLKCS